MVVFRRVLIGLRSNKVFLMINKLEFDRKLYSAEKRLFLTTKDPLGIQNPALSYCCIIAGGFSILILFLLVIKQGKQK